MVEIFRTTVQEENQARSIIHYFQTIYPDYQINFDLEDCDKILRIEGEEIQVPDIIRHANTMGIKIEHCL